MTRQETKSAASTEPDNYETLVLDFLNKEMASVQKNNQKAEHTDDLDALVSDLLNQVIQESNQPQDSLQAIPDEREAMFAEFPPVELKAKPAESIIQEHENASPEFESLSSNDYPFSLIEFPPMDEGTEPAESKILESDDFSWQFMDALPEIFDSSSISNDRPLKSEDRTVDSRVESLKSSSENLTPGNPPMETTGMAADWEGTISKSPAFSGDIQSDDHRKPAIQVPESQSRPNIEKPLFAEPQNTKSRAPLIVAVAAGLFAIIGFSAHHFLSSSNTESTIIEPPISSQETVSRESQTPEISKVVPIVAETAIKQPPIQSKKTEQAPPLTIKTENLVPASNETVSVPELPKNEKPGFIQRTLQIASTTSSAVLDKLVPSTMPDKTAPAAPRPHSPAIAAESKPTVSGVLIPAMPISQVSPQYPNLAVKTRTSATIVLDLVIDETGTVIDATPVSGPKMFHKEAVEAALQWKYQPASLGGVHVRSQSRITMNFKLK